MKMKNELMKRTSQAQKAISILHFAFCILHSISFINRGVELFAGNSCRGKLFGKRAEGGELFALARRQTRDGIGGDKVALAGHGRDDAPRIKLGVGLENRARIDAFVK